MATIATSSPDEPDDEDPERQELRRLLSEWMNWTGEDTRRSEAFRRFMDWLREPIEESDRKRRWRLFAEEWTERLKHLARDITRRRRRQPHDIEWSKDDEALPSEEIARVSDALSKLASLHPRIAETARLRFIAGLSLSETATLTGIEETEVRKHATYARAWLLRELSLDAADPDNPDGREPNAQESEDRQL
jgi:hypothetical protein